MEVIILAGGLGTRLRSVVSEVPKCMAYRSSGMKQKAGTVKMQDFSQMVQNTSAQATSKMTLGL